MLHIFLIFFNVHMKTQLKMYISKSLRSFLKILNRSKIRVKVNYRLKKAWLVSVFQTNQQLWFYNITFIIRIVFQIII